ncbi:MAG: hypothetical protein ABJF11_15925 [Reichenbachiella sp.]|uniref:hypothetical protein n=1 Tax=Reichenbachiella sp. TaxID=2184521 RepID=UPI003264326B
MKDQDLYISAKTSSYKAAAAKKELNNNDNLHSFESRHSPIQHDLNGLASSSRDVRDTGQIQLKADSFISSSQQTIQRYAMTDQGKESNGRAILLENPISLYAGPAQFDQANGIGGDIEFLQGASKMVGEAELKKVMPRVKDASTLAGVLAGFDEESETDTVTDIAKKKHYPSALDLEEQLKDEVRPVWKEKSPEEREAFFGTKSGAEMKEMIADLSEIALEFLMHFGNFSQSEIATKLEHYLRAQKELSERPLMPSDCRAMASYVAGFDAGSQGVETDEIAAGNVYEYTARDAGTAEWPFHYATIIMTDGADHITMENAAAKESDEFSKMRYDHSWFFEIYGAALGQTFDDKYASDMGDE